MRAHLFIHNLPFQSTEDDLREFFESRGFGILARQIITDKETGRSRGFGYVLLADEGQIDEAIALNDSDFSGRRIGIKRSLPRQKPGEVTIG